MCGLKFLQHAMWRTGVLIICGADLSEFKAGSITDFLRNCNKSADMNKFKI